MSSSPRGVSLFLPLVTLAALASAGAGAYLRARERERAQTSPAQSGAASLDEAATDAPRAAPPPAPLVAIPLALPDAIDAIVVGGGPSPDANQVSLEDDVRLAAEALGPNTVALFAGGSGTRAVQVADLDPRGDPLLDELGELLAPRGGRDAHYRETSLRLHGAATLGQFESVLGRALAEPRGPLTVFIAGHGEGGATPAESRVLFWGGEALDASTLASYLDQEAPRRAVRFVVTSCYAGGLGELAFVGGDRANGASEQARCGLFATSWDEEASGCDPDPERAHHDGFGVYFLSALGGRARDGTDRRAAIDLDHDGVIGAYEALTEARIASRSIDVPTTTSEIYLRAVAPRGRLGATARGPTALPEQRAVIDALLQATGLSGEAALAERLREVRGRKAENDAAMDDQSAEVDARYFALAGEVLSRWPVLDDPFHPDFASTIDADRAAIQAFLAGSPVVRSYVEADEELSAMSSVDLSMRLELALLRRLEQAYETIALARSLEARGGPPWARYLALRACEWGAP